MIKEIGKLIELTTSQAGVVYVPASQIASFKAGGPGSIVELYVQNKPETYSCVESPGAIASQGPFIAVTASGATLYLNMNRIAYVKADGSGSVILYAESEQYKKVTVTESPLEVIALTEVAVGSPGRIKTKSFVWDSAVDGPIAGDFANPSFLTLGPFGTAGKDIGQIRVRAYTDTFTPAFAGPGAGMVGSDVYIYSGGDIAYYYSDDGGNDQLTTNGWCLPAALADVAQVDPFNAGVGPSSVDIIIQGASPGTTWSATGRIEVVVEWVENE